MEDSVSGEPAQIGTLNMPAFQEEHGKRPLRIAAHSEQQQAQRQLPERRVLMPGSLSDGVLAHKLVS